MRAFVVVAENESFTGAGRQLQQSKSAVSRRVGQLEERLGSRLLTRSTRRVSLTPDGVAYLEHCQRITSEIEEVEAAFASGAQTPRGTLSVCSPTAFGVQHVAPALCELQAEYPELSVQLTLLDRPTDPANEGFDLVIRDLPGPTGHLIETKISLNRHVLVAAPSYFESYAEPDVPEDLGAARCVHYTFLPAGRSWTLFDRDGTASVVRVRPSLVTTSGAVTLEGGAVALLPTFLVADDLRSGDLVRVLPTYQGETFSIGAACSSRRLTTAKVRRALEILRNRFGGPEPPWDEGLSFRAEPTMWIG